jgi:hypothetical protein
VPLEDFFAEVQRLESYGSLMRRITIFIVFLLILVLGGGFVFLATWEIPAPSQPVEKVLDNDRFPR